jgi:hypothetical protein
LAAAKLANEKPGQTLQATALVATLPTEDSETSREMMACKLPNHLL